MIALIGFYVVKTIGIKVLFSVFNIYSKIDSSFFNLKLIPRDF